MRIHEIYRSIQGESTWAGKPCTFVRTTGCDLRCTWCDTEQAFFGGETMSVEEVLEQVDRLGSDLVELTGGEPLLQKELPELARALLDRGATVLCETGGHLDISKLPSEVIKIMDVKCPGSGECAKNLFENFERLSGQDEIKFVLKDRADFDWAVEICRRFELETRCAALLFSPVHGELDPKRLVDWMIDSGIDGRLNLQLHKVVWTPETQGV